jgi:hypothetical protein
MPVIRRAPAEAAGVSAGVVGDGAGLVAGVRVDAVTVGLQVAYGDGPVM